MLIFFFFFFSSRRRHTIWNCDWSSDVCSSDLSRTWPRQPASKSKPTVVVRYESRRSIGHLIRVGLGTEASRRRAESCSGCVPLTSGEASADAHGHQKTLRKEDENVPDDP